MILTNILLGKKYGIVQMDSLISLDFLFLTIELYCCDRIFSEKYVKGSVSIAKCAKLKKNSPKETQENLPLTLLFWLC